jgi:hypothetical protein
LAAGFPFGAGFPDTFIAGFAIPFASTFRPMGL